ncbi:uroporphyrinogen-III C-methyltransferase [Nitrincola sp. MINF-07-Sa-05]|uniref:uroporphyrinogen-III C-methyltransferase n=1 Tax=Nitrincola salilacus TaxID=3400273 RepID=UPI0039185A27
MKETPDNQIPDSQAKQETKADDTTEQTRPVDTAKQRSATTGSTTNNSSIAWPGILALVLAIIALLLSGYLIWENLKLQQQAQSIERDLLSQVESSLEVTRGEVSQNLSNINQQLGQIQSNAETGQRNIDELHERLTRSIQQVTAQQRTSDKDWLLAETEYLLRLANQRVLMEQTASGALTLLKSADEILLEADDASLYPVREALASDIAALEAVPQVDTEGVFLRLSAMKQQASQLRQIPVTDRRQLPNLLEEMTPDDLKDSWGSGAKAAMNSAMDKFEQLIVIQRHNEPIEPLLSPEQTYYLKQNLELMFEQAQLSLLQRQQAAYDDSLNKAADWINTYFEPEDSTTQALLRGISELENLNVAPEIPAITGSLQALQAHLAELRRLKLERARS